MARQDKAIYLDSKDLDSIQAEGSSTSTGNPASWWQLTSL